MTSVPLKLENNNDSVTGRVDAITADYKALLESPSSEGQILYSAAPLDPYNQGSTHLPAMAPEQD